MTFSTTERSMPPGGTARYMLSFKIVKVETTKKDRPLTSNNPKRKGHMGLYPRGMNMENVAYMVQRVVYGKGGHIGRGLYPHQGNVFTDLSAMVH
ncbi:hypothetical protein AVEN_164682-1 [Araneus ventricosus]|uniref:Uncharacterized protein n=1 Tax=Araneus ventricosus TaxID=182803 RepID=A0A4Y2APP8_ARAVE|nr:hypothetical protein AVEN_164682-1 [Araneus ventricosus]